MKSEPWHQACDDTQTLRRPHRPSKHWWGDIAVSAPLASWAGNAKTIRGALAPTADEGRIRI